MHTTLNLQSFYTSLGLNYQYINTNVESSAYNACSFLLNKKIVLYRKSKITPKKIGQFVAIWKRDELGKTRAYEESDNLDFLIIYAESETETGEFIFPKHLLIDKGIISTKNKDGKRGIRVYPNWDIPNNKQAIETQKWQLDYFVNHNLKPEQLKNSFNSFINL